MTFVKGEIPEGAKPFKEGESGNPNGRPKGKSFRTILEALLDLEASEEDLEDSDIKKLFPEGKVTNREIFMARLVLRAKRDPDSKSAERLLNRVDGLPKQSIDHKIESTDNRIIIESSPSPPLAKTETDVDAKKE
jgi:hypothetical protein